MPIYGQENPLSDRTKPIKGFFPVWDILFSYSETLSENGSHELTGALHILGPTLEAMNWRHCIPRVGVHYIESTLCPTVADWSLSDRGRLEPVRPWSIGQHGHAIFHWDDTHCQCFTWYGLCRFFHALHSPSRYHPKPLPDSEMFSEAEYVSLKGLKSRSPEEETRWPPEIICKKGDFQAPTATFLYLKQCFF